MIAPVPLLAQLRSADSIFNNMGSSLRERNGMETIELLKLLLVAVAAVLAIGLAAFLLVRLQQAWQRTSTWLFLRLCHVQHLSWHDRWLLWHAARQLHLVDPAQLFTDPLCLEDAAALPGPFARSQRLLDLQAYLFAGADELPADMLPATSPIVTPTPPVALTPAESEALDASPKPDSSSSAIDDAAFYALLSRPAASAPVEWPTASSDGSQGVAAT
jgi:hypothetical protein